MVDAPILRIGKSGDSRQMPMYFASRSKALRGLASCSKEIERRMVSKGSENVWLKEGTGETNVVLEEPVRSQVSERLVEHT